MSDPPIPAGDAPVQRLDVRTRHVFTGGGQEEVHASVSCPKRERGVPLAACATCGEGAGVVEDARGQAIQALCRFHPDAGEGGDAARPAPRRDDALAQKLSAPIAGAMTRTVICVRAELSISALKALLMQRGISGVPVVDAEGRPIGVVSRTDLLTAGEEGSVASIMTELALSLHESSSIAQAAALMAYEGVHRLPIVDDGQQVVGLVSSLDVLHWIGERAGYLMRAGGPRNP